MRLFSTTLMQTCCAACLMFSALTMPAMAEEAIPPSPIVKTALVVDAPTITTGEPIWAGVTFTIPDHWHIYWQNPGDSGIPTTLSWTLPQGLTAGEIQWPVPEAIDTSSIINYGYSHHVTLPVQLTPTQDKLTGDVQVKASWLVCKDICIPESATLTAPLAANSDAAKQITASKALTPQDASTAEGWIASYQATLDKITIKLNAPEAIQTATNAQFFPIDDGIVANSTSADLSFNPDTANVITITMPRGSADLTPTFRGVLQLRHADGTMANIQLTAQLDGNVTKAAPVSAVAAPAAPVASTTFITSLLLAFLGGLILNIMPCVLPILALKALAVAKKAHVSRKAATQQGVAYTLGVIASFLAIAAVMLALKASGAAIGWGFQLQNPIFVGVLAVVMLLVSANLLGLFELPVLFGAKATGVNDHSLRGSFLTGALAVLVATPCTAPFMATAIGATLALAAPAALAVFAALGLGMAAPFLLISLWPAARRLLPKPGKWMHRFKQILSIPMLATAAWLVWVLVQLYSAPIVTNDAREIFTPNRLAELRSQGTPVLVDATAAWCLTCKVNERMALHPESMQQFFRDHQVTLMVADWTSSDPAITAYLASFGRNGVPLVVYYPPSGEPVVLPQILTPSIVRDAIASPRE